MKKYICIALIAMMSMVLLTACGPTLSAVCESEKSMAITAERASVDDFVSTGSLEVRDGEQLLIKSDLEKGEIELGFVLVPEEQSIDEVPDVDADPTVTELVSGTGEKAVELPNGDYQVKVTVTKKATGTVQLEVLGQ